MAEPAGRFSIAFDDPTLAWNATWTALDQLHPSLVTRYTIDRGRQFELDRTDTGRAVVEIADRDGILDPTSSSSPYAGKLEPLLQAAIARKNPVDGLWYTRFRGFIEDFDYRLHPSQRVNMLTLSLVDMFEVLSAVEMHPGKFGDDPLSVDPPLKTVVGQVYFVGEPVHDRVTHVLQHAGIPTEFSVVFSGNVIVDDTIYSPGENAMSVIQEAADAEFPGVSNVYVDRKGRICFHGRLAKFDPSGVHASAPAGSWDWFQWRAGDGADVNANPTQSAHIREFAYNRGLSKIINRAYASPQGIKDDDVAGQVVEDLTSIGLYGIRPWTASDLQTFSGQIGGTDALTETKRFASYYVGNFSQPQNRVTQITFRSMNPWTVGGIARPRAAPLWRLLSRVDISDTVTPHITAAGGGGFGSTTFFVEGVHEAVEPLTGDYDDVTLSLDLSPEAYFGYDPWA